MFAPISIPVKPLFAGTINFILISNSTPQFMSYTGYPSLDPPCSNYYSAFLQVEGATPLY